MNNMPGNNMFNQNNMKPCKYCKQMIDKKASVCPYCRKSQSSALGCGCLTAIVVFVMLFLSVSDYARKQRSSGSVTVPSNTSSQADVSSENSANENSTKDETVAETETENDFSYEITDTSFNYYKNSIGNMEYHAFVEITNTGSCNIYMDDCVFDLEDNDGHLLQSEKYISSCPDVIAPGEKGYFYNNAVTSSTIDKDVSFDNGIKLVPNYKLEKATGEIKDFEVSDTDMRSDDYGNIKITGRVTNDTDKDESIYLNVIFYNSDGKVLMITGTNVTGLDANTTVSFECTTMFSDDSVNKDDIATYQVIARDSYYQWWPKTARNEPG